MKIQKDKKLHFIVGLFVAMCMGLFWWPVGIASAFIAGVIKELYDHFKKSGTGFDWKDLVFTLAGGVIGTALSVLLSLL